MCGVLFDGGGPWGDPTACAVCVVVGLYSGPGTLSAVGTKWIPTVGKASHSGPPPTGIRGANVPQRRKINESVGLYDPSS